MLYWLMFFLLLPIRFMPRGLELFLGEMLGLFLYHVVRFKRNIVRKNLLLAYWSLSFEEIKKLEIENYIHYGRLVFELLHVPFDAVRFAEKNVRVHNIEHLEEALKKGKGVFFLSAHVGFWEIMGVAAMFYKVPLNIITKYMRLKIFDDVWVKSRASYGIKLINEAHSARNVLKAILKGEVVGVVLDQFMGPPVGDKVNFFGRPAWTITSLAWFAQRTQAPVIPVVNYRRSDGSFDLILYPDVGFEKTGTDRENIKRNTQRYSNIIEEFIKKHPEQWIWVHKRWKSVKEDAFKDNIYS
ncbi:MAG: lysophospholipid acyltransferase family protein [Pseudomonadota bacterium]